MRCRCAPSRRRCCADLLSPEFADVVHSAWRPSPVESGSPSSDESVMAYRSVLAVPCSDLGDTRVRRMMIAKRVAAVAVKRNPCWWVTSGSDDGGGGENASGNTQRWLRRAFSHEFCEEEAPETALSEKEAEA